MKIIDTIMMIDDDEATNFLHKIVIEDANCCNNLIIVDDAQKALQMLEGEVKPDLLFLDINMPRMNGWEFLDAFRKFENSNFLHPKIIIFSTSINPKDKEKASEYQNVRFMSKPLTEDLLEQIINDQG